MTTLLICNGEPPSRDLIRRMRRRADRLVAADGGANAVRALGLVPDLILGDLDSVTRATRRAFANVPTIQIRSQDNTDLEKALDHCAAEGDHAVIIAGRHGQTDRYDPGQSVCVLALPATCRSVSSAKTGTPFRLPGPVRSPRRPGPPSVLFRSVPVPASRCADSSIRLSMGRCGPATWQ